MRNPFAPVTGQVTPGGQYPALSAAMSRPPNVFERLNQGIPETQSVLAPQQSSTITTKGPNSFGGASGMPQRPAWGQQYGRSQQGMGFPGQRQGRGQNRYGALLEALMGRLR